MKEIYIFGAGGMAREVADIIRDLPEDYLAKGFVDRDSSTKGSKLNDVSILGGIGDIDFIKSSNTYFSCGFGEINIKKRAEKDALSLGLTPIILIHPSVIKTPFVEIGDGTIICAGSVITNNIKIGKHVLVNLNATIGHDAVIGDYCTISPGCHISGRVIIEDDCYIGTGAVILPNITIGKGSIVGAGAVVTKDVKTGTTVVGIPAKQLIK